MPQFEFFIDQKETVWRRNYRKIEYETEEEAILKMRSLALDNDYGKYITDSQLITETFDDMEYVDNNFQPTREVYYNDEMIEDNTPLSAKRDKKLNQLL